MEGPQAFVNDANKVVVNLPGDSANSPNVGLVTFPTFEFEFRFSLTIPKRSPGDLPGIYLLNLLLLKEHVFIPVNSKEQNKEFQFNKPTVSMGRDSCFFCRKSWEVGKV